MERIAIALKHFLFLTPLGDPDLDCILMEEKEQYSKTLRKIESALTN